MEKEMILYWTCATALALLGALLCRIFKDFWWRPLQLKRCFESQGIKVVPYRLFSGNMVDIAAMTEQVLSTPMPSGSHDICPRVFPHFHIWTKTYGKEFVYWYGNKPRLYVHSPEFIREVLIDKCGRFGKKARHPNPLVRQLLGEGLVTLPTGDVWAKHRKILNPAFHMDILKGMIPRVVDSCNNMLGAWRDYFLNDAAEMEVSHEFQKLTSDVISRTAFGGSYQEGKHIFDLQAQQLTLTVKLLSSAYLPGFRFLPTKMNRECWTLEKEIRRGFTDIILTRDKTTTRDLLGLMLAANKNQGVDGNGSSNLVLDEIIDECKTFYFAGHETTSLFLTWTMILLGKHQDWQDKARKEVLQVCRKDGYPNAESLSRLNIVGMILNEVLRLYPVVTHITRETCKPTILGNVFVPAGTQALVSIVALHHDPESWGEDANDFNPARFSEGIGNAVKHPVAFMPFGFGPRICIGLNFALIEAKVVVSMILQRFLVTLSASYIHAPAAFLTLRPQHGAQVILTRI